MHIQTHLLPPVIEETRFISLNNHNIKEVPPVFSHNVVHPSVPAAQTNSVYFKARYEGVITHSYTPGLACPYSTMLVETLLNFNLLICNNGGRTNPNPAVYK